MLGISLNVVFIAVIQHLGTSPPPGFVFVLNPLDGVSRIGSPLDGQDIQVAA